MDSDLLSNVDDLQHECFLDAKKASRFSRSIVEKLYCFIHFSVSPTLLPSEWPKLYGVLAVLSAIGLKCLK